MGCFERVAGGEEGLGVGATGALIHALRGRGEGGRGEREGGGGHKEEDERRWVSGG